MRRALIRALRANEFDLVTPTELGRREASDEEQLTFATGEGRTVLTSNVKDYVRLHGDWMAAGLHHAGMIFVRQGIPVGIEMRALTNLMQVLTRAEMNDRVEYLSDWVDREP